MLERVIILMLRCLLAKPNEFKLHMKRVPNKREKRRKKNAGGAAFTIVTNGKFAEESSN